LLFFFLEKSPIFKNFILYQQDKNFPKIRMSLAHSLLNYEAENETDPKFRSGEN